jgi:hypothetical protein
LPLDPDPDPDSESGSGSKDLIESGSGSTTLLETWENVKKNCRQRWTNLDAVVDDALDLELILVVCVMLRQMTKLL